MMIIDDDYDGDRCHRNDVDDDDDDEYDDHDMTKVAMLWDHVSYHVA